jgi:hypothetical protein
MYGYSPDQWKLPIGERLTAIQVETADGKPFPPEEAPLLKALRGETVRGDASA